MIPDYAIKSGGFRVEKNLSGGDIKFGEIGGKGGDAVFFYFATCRLPAQDKAKYFSSRRSDENHYGTAKVHVPEDRKFGTLRRPFRFKLLSFTLFEAREDPRKHFIIEDVEEIALDTWKSRVGGHGCNHALIFVHGFNTTFRDAIFRSGQIFWDLQYDGVPILFSWASGGDVVDYVYDKDSAIHAGQHFRELLKNLNIAGIEKVHVIAHSMGNYMLLNALDGNCQEMAPFGIKEVVMASPDIDRDIFLQKMPQLCNVVPGMTLYASSADRALKLSMKCARNVPRAGYISSDGPVTLLGVDTIDVTEIGEEPLGFGHGAYSEKASILNDIGQILEHSIRPPHKRLVQLKGMPSSAKEPKWWRFVG
ncbi:MAG: alpha/beta hydrolase [Yoonia sp.]|uniref:alpha/beta hydrolase n=1 Tax=Yoonia sp. TaxID=2212373 RepID=UPI0032979F15